MAGKLSEKTKKLLLRRVLPAGTALAALTCGAFAVNSAQYRDRFLPGTKVNSIDVSDMTLDEAESALRDSEEDYSLTLRFRFGNKETLSPSDMGISYNCRDELQELLDQQNRFAWISRQFSDPQPCTLRTVLSYDGQTLGNSLSAMPEFDTANMIAPEDANLKLGADNHFQLVTEIDGTTIDEEALDAALDKAITSSTPVLDLAEEGAYEEPAIRAGDPVLTMRMTSLNTLLDTNVEIPLSESNVHTVDSSVTKDWLTVNEEGLYTVSEADVAAHAADYIAQLAKEDDTYGEYQAFASTNYGIQRFESDELHGHALDQPAMSASLAKMALAGETGTIDPVYSKYEDNSDPRFGGTYVEVDVYAQHVYYYEDYELKYECSCVTGTEGYRSTPSGIFCIEEMERGRYLNGYTSSGELAYSSWVNYWMCFLPHYGLHDATWRDSFGGDIYLEDGSHGCVNLPYSAAETLYDLLDYGTPVIILRGEVYEEKKGSGSSYTGEEGDGITEELEDNDGTA